MTFRKISDGNFSLSLCGGWHGIDKRLAGFCRIKEGDCFYRCLFSCRKPFISGRGTPEDSETKLIGGTFLLLGDEQLWNS